MNESWITLNKAFDEQTISRASTDIDALCKYGIKPLDDYLVCMAKNELVVIGADSGCGKSEVAINIARVNIKSGKKVALYYLEGGYQEAIARMKWRDMVEEYYKNPTGRKLDYRKWILNLERGTSLEEIEGRVRLRYQKEYKDNLYLYSKPEGLDLHRFTSSLLEFHKLVVADEDKPFKTDSKLEVDLIIVDHLQYFSLTKAESEIFEITEILREAKNITDTLNVPVILISHLRKKTKDRGLPGQEDFYGSSNIPKIASTVITLSPASDGDDLKMGIFPTYIRVAKSRIGVRPNYAFKVDFYLETRSYADKYEIYRLDSFGNVLEKPLEEHEKPDCVRRNNVEPKSVG